MGEISADSEDDPEQYECVVCYEIKPSPELCGNCYAIICTDCVPLLPECPECQEPREQIVPNAFLKNIINDIKYTCAHGCEKEFRFADKDAHDKVCQALKDPIGFKEEQERVIMEKQKMANILL